MLAFGEEFRGVGVGIPQNIAGKFDDGDLHAEADAKIRHVMLAGIFAGEDFSFDPPAAEAAGDEDAVGAL